MPKAAVPYRSSATHSFRTSARREHWKLLALGGGHAFDLAGEWDGYALRPLGIYVNDVFRVA